MAHERKLIDLLNKAAFTEELKAHDQYAQQAERIPDEKLRAALLGIADTELRHAEMVSECVEILLENLRKKEI